MGTSISRFVLLYVGFFWMHCCSQVRLTDDLAKNAVKSYFRMGDLGSSADGKWISLKKMYTNNSDTTLIFSGRHADSAPYTIVGPASYLKFFGANNVLVSGGGKAEMTDLSSLRTHRYQQVKGVGVLDSIGWFYLHRRDAILSVFDQYGAKVLELSDVEKVLTDEERFIYALQSVKQSKQIIMIGADCAPTYYACRNDVSRMELKPGADHLLLYGYLRKDEAQDIHLSLLDLHRRTTSEVFVGNFSHVEYVALKNIPGAKGYLIDVQVRHDQENDGIDLWYGNDKNLKNKRHNYSIVHHYFVWNVEKENLVPVEHVYDDGLVPIDLRYCLIAKPSPLFNYETRDPMIDLYVYDIAEQSYEKILTSVSQVVVSNPIDRVAGFDLQRGQWIIYSLNSRAYGLVEMKGLKKPLFDDRSDVVYFEGNGGLWAYDFGRKTVKPLETFQGADFSIKKYNSIKVNDFYDIRMSTIDRCKPILIEKRAITGATQYLLWAKNQIKAVTSAITHHISEIVYLPESNRMYTIEEHFNMPPTLMSYDHEFSLTCQRYNMGYHDAEAKDLRQEIIHYKNIDQRPLKGILYYPIDYERGKKYPMVVHIYQQQRNYFNHYTLPSPGGGGLDLRALLREGYFVYLPDIVFDARGSGVSALDCVNKSLDALGSFEGINFDKVGLMGHSMGGYETNFIATHSSRFSAYISGSGHSDIVRAYYSYSYDNYLPLYWQFENGQYAIGIPLVKNKNLYYSNNPIYFVENVSAPILIWTGRKDENVHWDQTMEFYVGLKRNNKDVIAIFYSDEGHILDGNSKQGLDLNQRVLDWWNYFLKDKKTNVQWIMRQMKRDA